MIALILFVLAFPAYHKDIKVSEPHIYEHQYRAVKYSMVLDFTSIQDIVPIMENKKTTNIYYVEYGDSLVIRLSDPADNPMLVEWDYRNCTFTPEIYLDGIMKYYKTTDTIHFAIEDSRGVVANLCEQGDFSAQCDSVRITKKPSNVEYLLYVNDTISNIGSHELFYPDIKYLPYKIVKCGKRTSIWNLEEMIYGKQAIDSLLQLYHRIGYERISEEEWKSLGNFQTKEDKELLKMLEQRLKE